MKTRILLSALIAVLVAFVVAAPAPVSAAPEAAPPFLRTLGTPGGDEGQLRAPEGMAIAGDGSIYVADSANDRIQRFDATGAFVLAWNFLIDGGSQPWLPRDVAIDGSGNVYVAGSSTLGIAKFTGNGEFLTEWWDGSGPGDSFEARSVEVGPNGHVYVADNQQARIIEFTATGTFVREWDANGSGDSRNFGAPQDLAFGGNGDLYVVDGTYEGPDRVQRFTASGGFVSQWAIFEDEAFAWARGVAVAADGNVSVVDGGLFNARVGTYTAEGAFVEHWGSPGSAEGALSDPEGIAIDGDGRVYLSEPEIDRVQVFGTADDLAGRPDGRIKLGSGSFVGDDIYNTTAANQSRTAVPNRGGRSEFTVSLQNDSPDEDRLRVLGGASVQGYTVRYIAGGVDVTARVVAGTYRTPVLAPGATHAVRVRVDVATNAARFSSVIRKVKAVSENDPSVKDAVKFAVYVNSTGGA